MKIFAPGTLVILNEKTQPLLEHKGRLIPGRRAQIIKIDFLNKRKRKCWYLVRLFGKSMNVIGESKVPSNWLDVGHGTSIATNQPAVNTAKSETQ